MKKFLLAAICLTMSISSFAEDWGIVGDFNDWNAYDRIRMQENADNTYTLTMESLSGAFKFVADTDWILNYGAKDNDLIYGNGTVSINAGGPNFFTEETLENVTITLNPDALTVTFSGLPKDMEIKQEPEIREGHFIIGDPSGVFNPSIGIDMREVSEGVYEWLGQLSSNMYFSFTTALVSNMDEPWAYINAHRYGAVSKDDEPIYGDVVLEPDVPTPICYPMKGDMSWNLEETGVYRLTLNTNEMLLTAENLTTWGVTGDFNGWGESGEDIPMQSLGEGKWEVSLADFSGEFKFRVNNEWGLNIGSATAEGVELNQDYPCGWNLSQNFKMIQPAERIHFLLDTKNLLLTTSVATSLGQQVNVDENPRFLNLQGLPVENPTNGIYIRITPSKTEKVHL